MPHYCPSGTLLIDVLFLAAAIPTTLVDSIKRAPDYWPATISMKHITKSAEESSKKNIPVRFIPI
jgi:hypothetical protein